MPWDQTENYMQRSLTNLLNKVKTPSLLMTGEADYRTPISEAEQFYEGLKLLSVGSILVRFREEAHGLRRRPSHHVAKMLHVAGWFDRHRKWREMAACRAPIALARQLDVRRQFERLTHRESLLLPLDV